MFVIYIILVSIFSRYRLGNEAEIQDINLKFTYFETRYY